MLMEGEKGKSVGRVSKMQRWQGEGEGIHPSILSKVYRSTLQVPNTMIGVRLLSGDPECELNKEFEKSLGNNSSNSILKSNQTKSMQN